MPKMRLGWYAGVSTALAGGVVVSAFHQRANFYSAMVYLAQSNFCLLALVNFTLLLYSSFIYALTRLCFGTLRAVEVEQLTERAWFAITETCLAMTIFREEIGAWFLVMFTALVTGKVWGWIGDGRVEFLEQQPPPNPRLFHLRLSVSLSMSLLYDVWILRYTVNSVIQQARPNMMVMFLFEFAVLATCSWRTGARYILSLAEQNIVKAQTRKRLEERKREIRNQREAMMRERAQADAAGQDAPADQPPLPSEDDVDEMDIEVPGWASKGEWVLWLDLVTDMIKLGIYVAFFAMLLTFYGLPIHIMRDLFMTSRDFVKRLNALLRYRRAIQEMKRYRDATAQDLAQENTCIICREEMRPWNPDDNPGAVDRVRPKKLPCGHILHLGCLKSWLERQQVCPTCRSPVTADRARRPQNRGHGLRIQFGGRRPARPPLPRAADDGAPDAPDRPDEAPDEAPREQGPRVFNLGPIRVGFGANGQQVRELAQQLGMPQVAANQQAPAPAPTPTQNQPTIGDNLQSIGSLIQQSEQMVQREMQRLHLAQQELQVAHLLMAELQRLQQRRQHPQDQPYGQPLHGQASNGHLHQAGPAPNHQANHRFMPMHQAHFPGAPLFPGPSRAGSPLMARFAAAPSGSSAVIPAGSPDLPEGLALPAGWSLMPLQRLEGAPGHAHATPQQPMASSSPSLDGAAATRSGDDGAATATRGPGPAQPPTDGHAPSAVGGAGGTAEPASVAAPSPVMPAWGGSAQLFGGEPDEADASERRPPGQQAAAARDEQAQPQRPSGGGESGGGESSVVAHVPAPPLGVSDAAAQEAGAAPPDKGKARAATVEEAQDGQE